jgi:hypothetical protein
MEADMVETLVTLMELVAAFAIIFGFGKLMKPANGDENLRPVRIPVRVRRDRRA